MRLRRARLLAMLRPNEVAPTVSAFPLLGVGRDFIARGSRGGSSGGGGISGGSGGGGGGGGGAKEGSTLSAPPLRFNGPVARSAQVPDDVINPNPRWVWCSWVCFVCFSR